MANIHALLAYKRKSDGLYQINKSSRTYKIKETIKKLGGKWDVEKQCWIVPESALKEIKAYKRFKVRVESHCHEEEQDIFCEEDDVEKGFIILGCGICDKSYICGDNVKISKVYGEIEIDA